MPESLAEAGRQLHRQVGRVLAAPVLTSEDHPLDAVRAAQDIRRGAEDLMSAAVGHARQAGTTWQEIGDALGVSRQAAFQRYGKPVDPRTGEALSTTPLPDAVELAHAVLDAHAEGRWAEVSARFDDTMRAGLTDEGMAEAWAYLAGVAGAYEGHGDTEVVRAGDFTVTTTPLVFEAGEFVARITFRDDRTIAGLFVVDAQSGTAS